MTTQGNIGAHRPDASPGRRFLMLQGPHGPFFRQLAARLGRMGHQVWRVGFNRGDQLFWRRPGFVAFREPPARWPATCADLMDRLAITDLVLYGDSRPVHAEAVRLARARGLTIHVFEEGYLRPYWITYERDGSNGNSRLMQASLADIRGAAEALPETAAPPPPCRWGDMREHVFYGALYHFCVMALNRAWPNFRPHRQITVRDEFRLHLRKLVFTPWRRVDRALVWRRLRRLGAPIHAVLLQLEHDASFRAHSDFASGQEFVELCLSGFATGAPATDHLVFKAHPLEDGRTPLCAAIRAGAERHGLTGRVHYLQGGPLAPLLDKSRTAVTVNSTAGQQALWRGLPLRIFGRAVYGKPELVSDQPLPEFFAAPRPPDPAGYAAFRRFLLSSSQVPGGFYAERSRRRALAELPSRMLSSRGPDASLEAYVSRPDGKLAAAE